MQNKLSKLEMFLAVAGLIIAISIGWLLWQDRQACVDSGGSYVSAGVGMTCVYGR